MSRFDQVIASIRKSNPRADTAFLLEMERFIDGLSLHPNEISQIAERAVTIALIHCDLFMDVTTLAAGVLFAVVQDERVRETPEWNRYSVTVEQLVIRAQRVHSFEYNSFPDPHPENFRRMILQEMQDVRVLTILLAFELDRIRGMESASTTAKREVAMKVLEVYIPLAERFGISAIRRELEDWGFRYQDPMRYEALREMVSSTLPDREYTRRVIAELQEQITRAGIEAQIMGRTKNLFSIHRKMIAKQLPLDQILDLLAFRIIVPSTTDCYRALDVVNHYFRSRSIVFKDYIARPKSNHYQSLHLVVVGPEERTIEIQVRSYRMHRIAEHGVAAHWFYKEMTAKGILDPRHMASAGGRQPVKRFVYVLTPQGEVKEMEQGSMPLDFAYKIHTSVGHRALGVRVNGLIVPFRYLLQNGDRVEVILGNRENPKPAWFDFVVSSHARDKIRRFLRIEDEKICHDLGQRRFARRLHKLKYSQKRLEREGRMVLLLKLLGFDNQKNLFVAIGRSEVRSRQILRKVDGFLKGEEQEPREEKAPVRSGLEPVQQVRVVGFRQVKVKIARCCNPIPNQPIAGYITRGRGVSIHFTGCPNFRRLMAEKERILDAYWEI